MAGWLVRGCMALMLKALPRPLRVRLDAWSAARARQRAAARRARAASRRQPA